MDIALLYPPTCDPTAPYLAVPTLAAYLRKHGVGVVSIDANLEAWEHLLDRGVLARLGARVEERIAALEARSSLDHREQLDYVTLWRARGDAREVPEAIETALATMRDASRFFDPDTYEEAVQTIEAAQRVVSAAYAPLHVDFVSYRTPFSLLTPEEIAHDSSAERNPFHDAFEAIAERVSATGVTVAGISVAFPGQIQPAYALAFALKRRMPDLHVVAGGPALTQLLLRLAPERQARVLGPFDSAIIYEGELALLDLVNAVREGRAPSGVIAGRTIEDMASLPAPDFAGLPLERYLAPELVLPYDPSRGCYWGVCTFCHYGLAEVGTARYRERPTDTVLDHLTALSANHGTRLFYFSQDVFSPKIALRIARGMVARKLDLRWATDMRPERALNPEKCRELRAGGALATALGVESAAPRVLSLIDKGIPVADVRAAIENLAAAGVAVEAMCFSDFPTETTREAMETVRFIDELEGAIALFILGQFDLTHGSLIAQKPGEFGIKEVWQVEGDELGTGLFFAERRRSKRADQKERLDAALAELSNRWRLHRYPWAGALSTAHSLLWYREHGPDVFRRLGRAEAAGVPRAKWHRASARFDLDALAQATTAQESNIWAELVHRDRRVGRAPYEELVRSVARAHPSPRSYRYRSGFEPEPAGEVRDRARDRHRGRRSPTSPNATKAS